MDLSAAERAKAAAVYISGAASSHDSALIAKVLAEHPEDGIDQWLALGRVCPYDAFNVRKRAAWTAEIHRQRGEN